MINWLTPIGQHDSENAAEERQRHRLEQKLPDDIFSPRADRFADADLVRALGDADQHDVHHADAADEQPDA